MGVYLFWVRGSSYEQRVASKPRRGERFLLVATHMSRLSIQSLVEMVVSQMKRPTLVDWESSLRKYTAPTMSSILFWSGGYFHEIEIG